MYCLGVYYNEALLAIETNFSTYPIRELERIKYPNLYVREKEDSFTHQIIKSYGFRTTQITRPIIIQMVADMIRDYPVLINDRNTLNECLTFVRTDTGRAEALTGKHDDAVMSYGIALYIRPQQSFATKILDENKKRFKWSEDLKQDYYKADKETRERMIEKYGEIN